MHPPRPEPSREDGSTAPRDGWMGAYLPRVGPWLANRNGDGPRTVMSGEDLRASSHGAGKLRGSQSAPRPATARTRHCVYNNSRRLARLTLRPPRGVLGHAHRPRSVTPPAWGSSIASRLSTTLVKPQRILIRGQARCDTTEAWTSSGPSASCGIPRAPNRAGWPILD